MTYEERLAALEHMFPVGTTRVTQDVKDWLIGKASLLPHILFTSYLCAMTEACLIMLSTQRLRFRSSRAIPGCGGNARSLR